MAQLFAGSYTQALPHAPAACGQGIYTLDFDPQAGVLGPPVLAAQLPNPSFLARHGSALFAACELEHGQVSALRRDGAGLRFLNSRPALGGATAHVSVAAGTVMVANYAGGASVAAYPAGEDGTLGPAAASATHQGQGPNRQRQDGPHAHCLLPAPCGSYALAADLGTDELVAYDLDPARLLRRLWSVRLQPGSGPRHVRFHPGGAFAFVTLELSGEVATVRLAGERSGVTRAVAGDTQPSSPSELQLSPDGRFLYVSNRGPDTISGFRLGNDGELTRVGSWSTLGRTPRHFALSPDGAWLLAANQDSDSISVHARDPQSGELKPAGVYGCPTPTCLVF